MKVQNVSEKLLTDLYLDEDDLPPMLPLEGGEEEVKEGKLLKMLTANKY